MAGFNSGDLLRAVTMLQEECHELGFYCHVCGTTWPKETKPSKGAGGTFWCAECNALLVPCFVFPTLNQLYADGHQEVD
jgi:hypothetical protein